MPLDKTYEQAADRLTAKQRQFLEAYIQAGGDRSAATQIVMDVYGYERQPACVMATRLLKNDKIREALFHATFESFAASAFIAQERLMEILTTGTWFGQPVKPGDGLKAIQKALDRGGHAIATKIDIDVKDERSVQELRAAVAEKLQALPVEDRKEFLLAQGIPAAELHIAEQEVQDAEFEMIDPKAPFGRKANGAPKRKPGPKPRKRHLPGPDAVRPDMRTEIAKIRERMKKRKRAQARKEAADD